MRLIRSLLPIRKISDALRRKLSSKSFPGSRDYWDRRYSKGGTSGAGSYGDYARFKADVLNRFVIDEGIETVIEFGCGDGNQLSLVNYPSYVGYDISQAALDRCRRRFKDDPTKSFCLMSEYQGEKADMALSLDVVFHLVEDDVFEAYVRLLFQASVKNVVIFSSNTNDVGYETESHVRHRQFTDWVDMHEPDWKLVNRVENTYPMNPEKSPTARADFFFYKKPVTRTRFVT